MIDCCTEGRQRVFFHCLQFEAININLKKLGLLSFDDIVFLRFQCQMCLLSVSHCVINTLQFVTVIV